MTISEEGAVFTPWYSDDGAVGFKVTAKGLPDTYIYLNPSAAQDTGDVLDSDVFVYIGGDGDPSKDEPVCYVNVWEDERRGDERGSVRG
jgi:hypothetical protein